MSGVGNLVERLRSKMDSAGLSLREAAPLIGISFSTLGRVLRGSAPSRRNALKINRWLAKGRNSRAALLARIEALEKALGEARGGIEAFRVMVSVIQKYQALPIPAILEAAEHNCPIVLANIDAALASTPQPPKEPDHG